MTRSGRKAKLCNMPRPGAILIGMLLLVACPTAAAGDVTLARLARPAPVSTFDGHILWSEYESGTGLFHLTQRFNGMTTRIPVAPRSVPFDVDVGRDFGNEAVAAYSRCRKEPAGRDPRTGNALAQMPQWSSGRGCDVYMLNLRTNVEIRVGGASSSRASEFLPAVWRSRIVFARVYERRRGIAGKRAYLYYHSLERGGISRRLPAGARGRERTCSAKPRRCGILVEPGPTTLDLTGRVLTFGWDSIEDGGPTSSVYLDRIRSRGIARRLIARGASGEIQARELVGPQIDTKGRITWIESLFGDSTRSASHRYTISNGNRSSAPLQPVAGDPLVRTIIGSAVDQTNPIYLSSGLAPNIELCSPQSPCLVDPGCSDAQPCELRAAMDLQFTTPRRR
jgi:hypothetical protein